MRRSHLICIAHSWRLTPTAHATEQACWNEAPDFDLFIFWEEGGGRERHFREAEYFSLPWVGIKNILISLFTQNVPDFQRDILISVGSPFQERLHGPEALHPHREAEHPVPRPDTAFA